jgi:hypothetical protein
MCSSAGAAAELRLSKATVKGRLAGLNHGSARGDYPHGSPL